MPNIGRWPSKMLNKQNVLFKDHVFIVLFLILAVFLFTGLGNDYLWHDEAETAVLGRNTLTFGFPRAFDGINLVNPSVYTGFGRDYAWLYHPWLQFYLVALFFALFGESTLIARLPFALFGLFSLPLAYMLARRLFFRRDIARTTALLLASSISFILLMRQCRYYSLSVFFSLCVLLAYLDFIEKRRFALAKLFFSLILLYYSIHGVFIPVMGFLIIHYLVFHYDRNQLKKLFVFLAAVLVCTLPWFFYAHSYRHEALFTFHRLCQNFEFQIRVINKYIVPAGFLIVVYILHALRKRSWKIGMSSQDKGVFKFMFILIGISIVFFCTVEQRMLRYLVYLFPVFYIVLAYIICRWQAKHRLIVNVLVVILICTNLLHSSLGYVFTKQFRLKFKSYIAEYLYEITHSYHGPVEGMVAFLKEHARPGDTIKVPYDDHSLIFYCKGLKIDNSLYLKSQTYPEWIIFRRFWAGGEQVLESPYFNKIQANYKRYEIDAPDIPWQNRPDDLGYHKFKSENPGTNRIIIFGKR